MPGAKLELRPAGEGDFEAMLSLRLMAMRESLERLGRFDPERARQRLAREFRPSCTRHILRNGELVGYVVVFERDDTLVLDHLYIHPQAQREGIGSWVMRQVIERADARGLPICVTTLKLSDANRFYERHGFELREQSDCELTYVRPARGANRAP
jgi:ribosomal protein S18 acetylase RimI-like enzyme